MAAPTPILKAVNNTGAARGEFLLLNVALAMKDTTRGQASVNTREGRLVLMNANLEQVC